MQEQTSSSIQDLQKAAEARPGIRRVRSTESERGLSIRALVAPERTDAEATRIIREVAHELGIQVKEEAIEILRAGHGAALPDGARRRLMSLTTERLENRFVVRVVLELAGDLLMGDSSGVARKAHQEHHLVAEAVLNALADVIDFEPLVETVDSIQDEGKEFWVVTLESNLGTMIGASQVRQNEHDAVARATLDAINRATDLRRHVSRV